MAENIDMNCTVYHRPRQFGEPSRINTRETTPSHIILKLKKTKDKQKPGSSQWKKIIKQKPHLRGRETITADFFPGNHISRKKVEC